VHEHEDSQEPGQDEGMETVEAGEGGLTHTLSAPEQLNHEVTNHWQGRRHPGDNFDGPVTHLIPGEGITSNTKRNGDHSHGHSRDPGQFAGALKASSEVNPEHVEDQHQNHHAGAPAMDRANQPTETDVGH